MKPAVALAAALVLALAPARAADASALDLVFEKSVAGSHSFGVRVDTGPMGEFSFEILACCAYAGAVGGLGALYFDADKAARFGLMITGGISRERTVLSVEPLGPASEVRVDESELDAGSVRFTITTPPHATRYVVAYGAGIERTQLRVWAHDGAVVTVNEGSGLALGDPDFTAGGANAEAQRNHAPYQGVGAKALLAARADVAIERNLYGLFMTSGVKRACEYGAPLNLNRCVPVATRLADCAEFTGEACAASRISWRGPAGGAGGAPGYAFLRHEPAGAYAFTVDHKLDAWGPWNAHATPAGSVWLNLGEETTALVVADVALPA